MMENVIVYFSITTEPKVMIIDVKSNSIQFQGQWRQPWVNTINNYNM